MNLLLNKIFVVFVVFITTFTSSFSQTDSIKSFGNQQYKFKDKSIIGVGESTHNSHQEQVFSYTLIKELVQNYNFNIILIEAPSESIEVLDTYINNVNTTDIKQTLFKTQYLYWIWKTNEFAQLLNWLKTHNKTALNKIHIIGIDKISTPLNVTSLNKYNNDRDSLMALNIKDILNAIPSSKAILLAHNLHISNNPTTYNNPITHKTRPMGYYLKHFYGDNYFSIGQLFGKGSFNTQIKTNFNNLEMSYVTKDISNLSKELLQDERNKIILTSETKLLNRKRKIWFYGGTLNRVGKQNYLRENISNMFDAIIFHDSIYAASNLLINGNYFAKTVHIKKLDNTINEQEIHYKLDYNATSNGILEIQFYNDNKYVKSILDTLYYTLTQYSKTINIESKFNMVRVNLYLFNDGKIIIKSFAISGDKNKILINNLFQSVNNKELLLNKNSDTKLNTKYKDEQFEMYRYTDKKED